MALFLLLSGVGQGFAEEEGRWEIGIVGGLYKPSLKTLNRILSDPSLALLQDPNNQLQPNILFTPEARNLEVPSYKIDRAFGVEVAREINRRNAFLMTLNLWEGETIGNDIAPQITTTAATDFKDVPRNSRYDISITNLWLGWRYHIPLGSEKSRVYIDIGLIGLAYAQMTVDTLLKVTTPVAQAFPVASSLEATGWGLTSRWGFGGEYFLKKWIAISFRTSYIVGRVPKMKVRRFFPSGFSTPPEPEAGTDLQPRPVPGEVLTYANVKRGGTPNDEIRSNVKTLPLELNGIEGMIGIHFYF
ncbi:MAG: hypothetical protein HY282_11845 [Nitrospirae bacterium]|nr:hypothetical protein [Candidatus Manganitrophaceae bacterium]